MDGVAVRSIGIEDDAAPRKDGASRETGRVLGGFIMAGSLPPIICRED